MVREIDEIDWYDPNDRISEHFTVREATYLPSWREYHAPTQSEKVEILYTARILEQVRALLGDRPITVHSWIRPADYNVAIGGARKSAHIAGKAVDFSIRGRSCDDIRQALLPYLEELDICMEDLPGSNWVHIDRNPPRGGVRRFFKP